MGVKERQERDRETVSRAILDAARELFVRDGYQEVSIRKIAERVEYSPAAIYSYFESKDDIFLALAEEGFHLLFSYGATPGPSTPGDPLDTLRAIFWRYYEFSRDHSEYFALMFIDRTVPRISRDWERFGFVGRAKTDMLLRIEKAIEAGALPADTPAHVVFRVLLTALHGAATLCLCERLSPGEDPDALARATLDTVLKGLQSGAARNLNLSPCIHPASEDSQS